VNKVLVVKNLSLMRSAAFKNWISKDQMALFLSNSDALVRACANMHKLAQKHLIAVTIAH